MGEQISQTAAKIAQQDLNKRLDSKGGFSEVKDIHKIGLAVKKTAMQQLIDFIRTHHGNTRVDYFYQSFLKNSPEKFVDENIFRYPYLLAVQCFFLSQIFSTSVRTWVQWRKLVSFCFRK